MYRVHQRQLLKTTTTVLPLVHVEISLLCLLYPQWQAILQNSWTQPLKWCQLRIHMKSINHSWKSLQGFRLHTVVLMTGMNGAAATCGRSPSSVSFIPELSRLAHLRPQLTTHSFMDVDEWKQEWCHAAIYGRSTLTSRIRSLPFNSPASIGLANDIEPFKKKVQRALSVAEV